MKKPYISRYIEEYSLESSPPLYYDNKTQISYTDKHKNRKAVAFGPETTTLTETLENDDHQFLGPDTTKETATIENSDLDSYFLGPDTTQLTKSIENVDLDNWVFGPDTTTLTFTNENNDQNEDYTIGLETTMIPRVLDSTDSY